MTRAGDPTPTLAQALQHQREGRCAQAAQLCRRVLAGWPRHSGAMQLLGLALRRQGDVAGAIEWMQRSLAIEPRQPAVWNNLANAWETIGRLDEALDCHVQALLLQPDYPDAHYNRARVLRRCGRRADAAEAIERAVHLRSPTAPMLHLRANLSCDAGDPATALADFEAAIALTPGQPQLWHDYALALHRLHRPSPALVAHDRALALGLQRAEAHYNRGNTLQLLGRVDEALIAYRRALAIDALLRPALLDLARLRWRLGEADFCAELDAAAQLDLSPWPLATKAQLLWRADRHDDAAAVFDAALQRAPDAPDLLDGLARALSRCGRLSRALELHERACTLAPDDASLHRHRALSLLLDDRPELALVAAERSLALAPLDQHALAVLGLCWRLLGDPREAWLNDYDRLVRVVDVDPPRGWATIAAFNAELAAELERLHVDRRAPVDQTLRHGTQTYGTLFAQGHRLVDALRDALAIEIADQLRDLPTDAAHPFLSRRSPNWRFTDSWSSRLHAQGHHTSHVHPHGWVSAVYYVEVPDSIQHDGSNDAGWLHFGEPDLDLGSRAGPVKRVPPRPGRLVLFPSMMWHGTRPFAGDGWRLTVAFDIEPISPSLPRVDDAATAA